MHNQSVSTAELIKQKKKLMSSTTGYMEIHSRGKNKKEKKRTKLGYKSWKITSKGQI